MSNADPAVQAAHDMAATTMPEFIALVRANTTAECSAKLRFRDPDLSDQTGKDAFFYLWLCSVVYHPEDNLLSGVFFEVPAGFEKWHPVGQRLGFEAEDVFDWMVNDSGRLRGGYTLRVTRSRLPESERAAYDAYIGVETYEPV